MKNAAAARSVLFLLIGLGVWIGLTVDWDPLLAVAEGLVHYWWLVPVLVAAQASAFALAMPGSIMFVIIGLLYDPLPAAAMIAAGGIAGSVAGYGLSQRLGRAWMIQLQEHRLYRLLQDNSSFLMLCAIRTMPGFPHSVINYGSGLLRLPLARFATSAFVGYAVKGLLYATALRNMIEAEDGQDLVSLDVLWPLATLVVLFIAGYALQKYWTQRTRPHDGN